MLVCVVSPEMPRSAETVDAGGQAVAFPLPPAAAPELAKPVALMAEGLLPAVGAVAVDEDCELHPASRPTAAIPVRADVVIRMSSEAKVSLQQIARIWQFIYTMCGKTKTLQ